jgi:hypothetical protein
MYASRRLEGTAARWFIEPPAKSLWPAEFVPQSEFDVPSDSVEDQWYDLIFLDVRMPERDAVSIIRDLRKHGNIPVIMLTATGSVTEREPSMVYNINPADLRQLTAPVRLEFNDPRVTIRSSGTAMRFFSPGDVVTGEGWMSTRGEVANRGRGAIEDGAAIASPSVVSLHDNRERVKARFRLLRRLPSNHDNEGAAAPCPASVDRAIAFVDQMATNIPFFATLDDDGSAVIEFEDRDQGLFADLTFCRDGSIECYVRQGGQPSELFQGWLESPEARDFLKSHIDVTL